jgi:hypothetical protein
MFCDEASSWVVGEQEHDMCGGGCVVVEQQQLGSCKVQPGGSTLHTYSTMLLDQAHRGRVLLFWLVAGRG